MVPEGQWQQSVYDEALTYAVILMRGTTGHGDDMCGCIAERVQQEAPRSLLQVQYALCYSHNTDVKGFEGSKETGIERRDRTGVMTSPYPRGDPLKRDAAKQRWDDDGKKLLHHP